MRKTYTLIVMLAMLFVGANSVSAQTSYTDDQGVVYSIGETATVTGYTGTATEITIPATVQDVAVTQIGESAFEGNTTLEKVILMLKFSPGTVGKNVFKGCTNLNTVRYDESVEFTSGSYYSDNTIYLIQANVPESYCEGCSSVTKVISVYGSTTLGKSSFKDCTALTSATLGASFKSFGESAFENCTNLATVQCSSSSSTYTLYTRAFKNCESLTQVGPTTGTVRLGSNESGQVEVFMGCTSITKIGYRYGGTKIGARWFKGCTSLTSTALVNVAEIGESAFEGCTAIKTITFTMTTAGTPTAVTLGANAFKGCTSLETAQFDQKLKPIAVIPDGIFEGCTSLASVISVYRNFDDGKNYYGDLNGITSIGANAFKGCALLTRYGRTANVAIFPDDLTEIGDSAFASCSSLGTFRLYKMDAAPTLGEGAFTGIASDATFYIYPNNSYLSASKYANNNSWKVWFDGTNANYTLYAYVNKSKQYGTVSCDVPLHFNSSYTANIHKVVAADDSYSYLKAVSGKKLPANTGAVIEMAANGDAFRTSAQAKVLFDGSASEADFEDNQLVANVTENLNFVGNEGNTWNLILNDGKFVKANSGTLAAGLAYLPVTFEGGEAKELSLTTDEPTGIKTIDNGEPTVDNGAWYTIDGTRLQGEPTMKGIYVRGGKKVVVK